MYISTLVLFYRESTTFSINFAICKNSIYDDKWFIFHRTDIKFLTFNVRDQIV